jgi:hypothetical protein
MKANESCDLQVVVGVGAKPAVQLFLDAGLEEEAKGIKVFRLPKFWNENPNRNSGTILASLQTAH